MTKVFSLLLVIALFLGVALGGAFAGGVALGKSQGPDGDQVRGASQPGFDSGRQSSREFGRDGSGRNRQGFQRQPSPAGSSGEGSGGRSGFGSDQPRQQSPAIGADQREQGGSGQGFGGRPQEGSDDRGFGGRAGLGGIIDTIVDNEVTVTTPQGPVVVTVAPDTAILKVVKGSLEDLREGERVRVAGPRSDAGDVRARAITLVPEGAEGLFGGRGPRGRR